MNLHPTPGRILLGDCGRPCDPLSCLLFSALWLRCSQSLLVQVTPSAKDVDLTCSLTFLFRDATCLPVGPMSLEWLVNPFGRSDLSGPSLPPDVSSGEQQRVALPASERSRWRQGALHAQPQILQRSTGWMDVAPSFPEACDVLLGTPGALVDLLAPDKGTESSNSIISKNSWTIICLQEVHGKDEFLQAIQVLAPRFRLFGAFLPDNENAGGSAICICEYSIWATQPRYCQCPFWTWTYFKAVTCRLSIILPHWLAYPCGVGVILCDFNICDPEEGRFNVWNQSFTDGDPGKTAVFHSFFPYVFEIAQSDCTRRDSSALGVIRTLSRIDRIFINLPMAEARDFHSSSHVAENFGKKTIPSDHAAVRLVNSSRTQEQTYSQLVVRTSHFWFYLAATSCRPQILSWPVLCAGWIWSPSTQSQED